MCFFSRLLNFLKLFRLCSFLRYFEYFSTASSGDNLAPYVDIEGVAVNASWAADMKIAEILVLAYEELLKSSSILENHKIPSFFNRLRKENSCVYIDALGE